MGNTSRTSDNTASCPSEYTALTVRERSTCVNYVSAQKHFRLQSKRTAMQPNLDVNLKIGAKPQILSARNQCRDSQICINP